MQGIRCAKAAHLAIYKPSLARPESALDRLTKGYGLAVGEISRTFFHNGVLISTIDKKQAIQDTITALEDRSVDSVFEGAFIYKDVFIRADVIWRKNADSPWNLCEVKAATGVQASLEEYELDIGIQSWVLFKLGFSLEESAIMYVNSGCISPDFSDLFSKVLIQPLDNVIGEKVTQLQNTIADEQTEPDIEIGPHCEKPRVCEFKDHCWQHIPTPSVFNIPRCLKKWKLYSEGKCGIDTLKVSDFRPVKAKRIMQCYKDNERHFDRHMARKLLTEWEYPLSYFDLEAISYAVPNYHGTRPYQAIPFQYSCHIRRAPDSELEHVEFLHDSDSDPRMAFIRSLISNLPPTGSIIVYHQTYEIGRLKELERDFPVYSSQLANIRHRIVDLKKVVEETIYYPEFYGSFSIKKVAPVLLGNDASYDNLNIHDGIGALSIYLDYLAIEHDSPERVKLKTDLLDYCFQDSHLMVRMHEWLVDELEKP